MLLNRIHRHLKTIARGLLAMAGVLWLIAVASPCVLAQGTDIYSMSGHCPKQISYSKMGPSVFADCDLASAVNCQADDTNTPLTTGFGNFAVTPVLLALLPITTLATTPNRLDGPEFLSPDYPDPPLHLRYLVLLI